MRSEDFFWCFLEKKRKKSPKWQSVSNLDASIWGIGKASTRKKITPKHPPVIHSAWEERNQTLESAEKKAPGEQIIKRRSPYPAPTSCASLHFPPLVVDLLVGIKTCA